MKCLHSFAHFVYKFVYVLGPVIPRGDSRTSHKIPEIQGLNPKFSDFPSFQGGFNRSVARQAVGVVESLKKLVKKTR